MIIEQLQAYQFRNLKRFEYQAAPGLNVFVGANAQGKTNILEAVYTLAQSTSFRSPVDRNLINYNSSWFKLRGIYISGSRQLEAWLTYSLDKGKEFKLNQKKASMNHADRLRVVLFTPDDLYLVKGSPGRRRSFLDNILKEVSPEYSYHFDNYVKILKKRNLLLKTAQASTKAFALLNDLFIDNAARLILARINFVHSLEEVAVPLWLEMNGQGNLKIRYALSFPVSSGKINLEVVRLALGAYLSEKAQEEARRRTTLAGPHLDDLHLYLDDRIARAFASQGQQRIMAVSLKLAEMYTVKKLAGFYPVFLIDEVLAELDDEKRQRLLDHLSQAQFQSFMSAISLGDLRYNNVKITTVKNGKLL